MIERSAGYLTTETGQKKAPANAGASLSTTKKGRWIVAKRSPKVKLSKTEMLDKEIVRWTEKRDAAIKLLQKSHYLLERAKKARARLAKKIAAELEAEAAAKAAVKKRRVSVPKPKVTETTMESQCNSIANSEVFGEKLEAALKTELQEANNRLASAFNDSMGGKGPFQAVGGEPSKEQIAAEKTKRMKAAGFHPTKRS